MAVPFPIYYYFRWRVMLTGVMYTVLGLVAARV